ncbi:MULTISPECIES: helix-turn-helix domain-containing protein [Piscirickettsiaceae]|uniref:Cyclic nucleotide-binding domain-containing protein n=1 Tax=Hydrogenovibrio thermophilus TaxID=265883 RepID=A0A410H459_9GAMM|nr:MULTISPECIES: helix-turn-helix domain-containing protein [Piscirickettsiaceae]AZR81858.1 Crp/Fnr family transcriptional regulator [Thiomicrospira sp. S5]QAB15610.1 cyclic nucleotide-binding domain-containing protein [Hydrogenovibrio thermophilus]
MTEKHSGFNASCSKCAMQGICFANGLYDTDIERLDQLVDRKPSLVKGEYLYQAGENFTSLYAIRAGIVKVYSVNEHEQEVIHGFYLPGDIVGMEALACCRHEFYAVAMDTTTVCALPYEQLTKLGTEVPNLNAQIFSLMSHEIVTGRLHSTILTQKTAEQRLADFILMMSERLRARGYEHTQFRLNVLHRDVASYLNLTPETVSRILGKFQKQGWMSWKRKEVVIQDMEALQAMASSAG